MTNAEFARCLARIARTATTALHGSADGMWNPEFCAANCDAWAASICEEIQTELDRIAKRTGEA